MEPIPYKTASSKHAEEFVAGCRAHLMPGEQHALV